MTHGEDFVVTIPTDRLSKLKHKLAGVYPIKTKAISNGSRDSIKALNSRLHWRERKVMYQHDPRHVDMLVKDHGLEHGNSVQTPAVHDVTDEEPDPLDHMQSSHNRSQVAGCLFLSPDFADDIHCERARRI